MGLVVSRPWPSQLIQAVERASQEAKRFLRGAGSPWIVPRESKARLKPTLQCLSFMLLKKRMWFNVTPLWMVLELAFSRWPLSGIYIKSPHCHWSQQHPNWKRTGINCLRHLRDNSLEERSLFKKTTNPWSLLWRRVSCVLPKRLQRMLLLLQKSELRVRVTRCILQIRLARRISFQPMTMKTLNKTLGMSMTQGHQPKWRRAWDRQSLYQFLSTFSEIKAAMETDTELESLTTVTKKGWPENLVALSPLSVLTSGRNCHFRMPLCSRVKESWSNV